MACLATATTSLAWRRLSRTQSAPRYTTTFLQRHSPFSTTTTYPAAAPPPVLAPQPPALPKSSPDIHPSAFVHKNAFLGLGVTIGPFCTVGGNVRLGANTKLASHVVIQGQTTIGDDCEFAPFSVVGGSPQDKKHDKHNPEHVRVSELRMGSGCVVREYVTVNCGTKMGNGATVVGDDVWLLAGSHVGHDCVLEDRVVISNGTQLGGHVRIGTGAVLGGMVGVRQRVHIGRLAMVGAGSLVNNHVPPFSLVVGNRAKVRGVNIRGLKRNGIHRGLILDFCSELRAWYNSQDNGMSACRGSYAVGTGRIGIAPQRRRRVVEEDNNALYSEFIEFVSGDSIRKIDEAADGLGCCPYYLHTDR